MKVSEYENKRAVAVRLATEKAEIHGKSTWGFQYRNQLVQVSAVKKGGKVRVHTDNVANKGK